MGGVSFSAREEWRGPHRPMALSGSIPLGRRHGLLPGPSSSLQTASQEPRVPTFVLLAVLLEALQATAALDGKPVCFDTMRAHHGPGVMSWDGQLNPEGKAVKEMQNAGTEI